MRKYLFTLLALAALTTTASAATKKTATEPYLGVKLMAGLGLTAPLSSPDTKRDTSADTFLAGRAMVPLGSPRTCIELELSRDFNPDWCLTYRVGVWYTF